METTLKKMRVTQHAYKAQKKAGIGVKNASNGRKNRVIGEFTKSRSVDFSYNPVFWGFIGYFFSYKCHF